MRRFLHVCGKCTRWVLLVFVASFAFFGCGTPDSKGVFPQVLETALLSVSDRPTYDFGFVPIDSESIKVFTVTNIGRLPASQMTGSYLLSINFNFRGGSYPGTSGTCSTSLEPTKSCTLEISFIPKYEGTFQDTVRLMYHNGENLTSTSEPIIRGRGQLLVATE